MSMPSLNLAFQAAAASDAGQLYTRGIAPQQSDPPSSFDPTPGILLRLGHLLVPLISAEDRATTALLVATTTDSLAADMEFDRSRRENNARYASPAAFSRTLPSTPASELSVKLQLSGPVITFCTPAATGLAFILVRTDTWLHHTPHLTHALAAILESNADGTLAAMLLLTRGNSTFPFLPPSSLNDLIPWLKSNRS